MLLGLPGTSFEQKCAFAPCCGTQVEFATEAQAEAEAACAAAKQHADTLQAALDDARSTSEQRQARLQHLEGGEGAIVAAGGSSCLRVHVAQHQATMTP